MSYLYYITFVAAVIVLGWIFRPLDEHMTVQTSKHPIYGPKGVNVEKCARTYPELYGPDGLGYKGLSKSADSGKNADMTPTSTTAMYEDNGEFQSDTATRNAAYMNVFTFKPYAKMDFPSSGPPQPYLSDFANFHK